MEPIATTTSGKVRGTSEEGSAVFRGVPYAAPPVGALRFAAPAAPEAWDGVRDATAYGPTAPQSGPGVTIIPEPVEPGDDFLNANIWTPDLGDARLPVLVWIHGGGFVSGCNRSPWYRGTRFNRDGVVVVSINYRLGAEGFLEIEGAPSNRAILDQIAALHWVQDNIAAFGGDPAKVTIAGQSAGSASALTCMVNPRARGTFRSVIAMSGTSDSRMPPEAAAELAEKVAAQLGVRRARDELARFSFAELVDAAAAVATNPFARDALFTGFDPKGGALRPYADGETIADHPFAAIAQGAARDVPLLAGSTTQEINGVIHLHAGALDEDRTVSALGAMGLVENKLDRYIDHVGAKDPVDALAQAATDRAFREPLGRLLEDHSAAGGTTYAYQFDRRSPLFDGMVGAAHCLDIPFAFDLLDAERVADGLIGPEPPQSLADEMHRAWVDFVTSGDPGWERFDTESRRAMWFGVASEVRGDTLRFEREVFSR